MRAVGQSNRGRGSADFFDRDNMFQIAKAKAAISRINGYAMQAEFAHGGPKRIPREPVIRVDFGRERRDFVGCKTLRRFADHVGIIAKGKI
jgi:hypothetical protein